MVRVRQEPLLELSRVRRRPREPAIGAPAAVPKRVLVVVEDRLAGKRLARMLTAQGYEGVRVVRRAASALFLAKQSPLRVVFLDVALSDDAYQLASDLRRQVGQSALRLIALTSSIEQSTREQARDAGFERWLATPVVKTELDELMSQEDTAA